MDVNKDICKELKVAKLLAVIVTGSKLVTKLQESRGANGANILLCDDYSNVLKVFHFPRSIHRGF